MSTQLIFNADDYGRTPAVSRAIRQAHLNGVVTSTTCMMNLPNTAADIAIALRETPRLGLGVHLTLTADSPLFSPSQLTSITTAEGRFLKLGQFVANLGQLDIAEVKAEWRAQIEAFLQASGHSPTHLDSHHHSSYFSPALLRAMLELARDYHCPIRLPIVDQKSWQVTGLPGEITPHIQREIAALVAEFNPTCPTSFFADFYDENATLQELTRIFDSLPDGTSAEIMCHPGFNDPALTAVSSYNQQRETEYALLTDPRTLAEVQARHLALIHFAQLPPAPNRN